MRHWNMRCRWRTAAFFGLAACVIPLVGCAPAGLPQPLTQQELDSIVARDNDARWNFYFADRPEVDRPTVQRLGYITPAAAADFYSRCIAARGFDTDYVYKVGLEVGLEPSLQIAADLAYYTCVAEYPVDPLAKGYLSFDQLNYVYDYYLDRLAPCLRSLGYLQPAAPARADFLVGSFNGKSWNPYAEVRVPADNPTWRLIDERCPPLPASVFGQRHP
ncbi:MAG: hypothetical protein ABI632_09290 [Pseudolysinimonas sp.]